MLPLPTPSWKMHSFHKRILGFFPFFKKIAEINTLGQEKWLGIKRVYGSCKGPESGSQHPDWVPHNSMTPTPRGSASSGLWGKKTHSCTHIIRNNRKNSQINTLLKTIKRFPCIALQELEPSIWHIQDFYHLAIFPVLFILPRVSLNFLGLPSNAITSDKYFKIPILNFFIFKVHGARNGGTMCFLILVTWNLRLEDPL